MKLGLVSAVAFPTPIAPNVACAVSFSATGNNLVAMNLPSSVAVSSAANTSLVTGSGVVTGVVIGGITGGVTDVVK